MRTSEERVEELHHRMNTIKQTRAHRRYMMTCAAAAFVCLVIVISVALIVSRLPVQSETALAGSMSASIFAGHEALGYVIVAIVSLCLGVLVTVLCFRLKRRMDSEEKQNDRREKE